MLITPLVNHRIFIRCSQLIQGWRPEGVERDVLDPDVGLDERGRDNGDRPFGLEGRNSRRPSLQAWHLHRRRHLQGQPAQNQADHLHSRKLKFSSKENPENVFFMTWTLFHTFFILISMIFWTYYKAECNFS